MSRRRRFRLTVRTPEIDYDSPSWHRHKKVSYAFWYLVAGYVAGRQIRGMFYGTWPPRSGLVVLACLACLLHPIKIGNHRLEGHHWITYRRFRWWVVPFCLLNPVLYVVGVIPVSPLVNGGEAKLRHLFHFRNEWPGTLIALPTVGLLPLWLVLGTVEVVHFLSHHHIVIVAR